MFYVSSPSSNHPSPFLSFIAATRPLTSPQTQNAFQHLVLSAWNALPGFFKPLYFPKALLKYYVVWDFFLFFSLQKNSLPPPQSFHLTFLILLLEQPLPSFGICCVCVSFSPNCELLKEFGWIKGRNRICQLRL